MLAPRSWQTERVSEHRQRLSKAHLYLVCDEEPEPFLESALRGGVDIIQLRCKDAGDDRIIAAGRRFAAICTTHGALFILNDRPDLVDACGADGVHVGQDDVSIRRARELVGPERVIGLSTHSGEQIDSATGADYIGVGPVYETPTKPGRPAVGLDLVRYASEHAGVPFFAIGGVGPENVAEVHRAGAHRVAVVRALTQAADPERAARSLRRAITQEEPVGTT